MHNFDLSAEYDEASDSLRLRVSDSPAGQTKQTVHSEALTGLWPEVSIDTLASADWNRLKQVGNTLREIVLPGPLWALWREEHRQSWKRWPTPTHTPGRRGGRVTALGSNLRS